MATDWDARLARWKEELDLLAVLDDAHWVPLAVAVFFVVLVVSELWRAVRRPRLAG